MIERARLTTAASHVSFVLGDFLGHDFGGSRFDFIGCVAALHHMDPRAALLRMRSLLAPGGTLAILGLAKSSTLFDHALDAAGFIASALHRPRPHSEDGPPLTDPRDTYRDVRRLAADVVPGATFRRLLLFRYLLTWSKPR